MGKYQNRRDRRSAAAEPAEKAPVATEYRAPTAGLEDKVFTIGSTLDAAKFETVKEELGKHFATQSWSDGADAAMAFEMLIEPQYDEPDEPEPPLRVANEEAMDFEVKCVTYKMAANRFSKAYDEWSKCQKNWKNNRSRMFATVLQHCPEDLVQRLKSKDRWTTINTGKDVISLTRMIRDLAHAHDDTTQGTMAIVASDVALYTTYMSKSETPVSFNRTFQANVDTINTHGGCAGRHPELVSQHLVRLMLERNLQPDGDENDMKKVKDDAERAACDEYLSCLFILVADGGRYQGLKRALDNQYLMDRDAYPTTRPQALKLLETFKPESTADVAPNETVGGAGVAFTQTGERVITCYNCREKGHSVNDCPKLDEAGKQKFWDAFKSAPGNKHTKKGFVNASVAGREAAMAAPVPAPTPAPAPVASVVSAPASDADEFARFQRFQELMRATENTDLGFAQVGTTTAPSVTFASVANKLNKRFTLDPFKLYLDSCATYHSAFVKEMLHSVKTVGTVLQGNCNAGVSTSKEKGIFGPWSFWLNENGIANLLSIPQLEKDGYTVDYNSKHHWVVTTPAGKCLIFKADTGMCEGMPYLDVRENHEALVLVQTVRDNFGKFTERQVQRAVASREMQARMAHPTDETFKQMVSGECIDNCPVIASDVTNARTIFGPNRAGLRGKTVRQRPERVIPEYLGIPKDFYRLHHFVTLTADVMFVNGIAFFTTLGRDIRFGTAEHVPSRTAKQLAKSLMKVIRLYALGGFVVRNVLMDGEFAKIKPEVELDINISAANEHVGEIERYHRTLKERCRCTLSDMRPIGSKAYQYLHKQIVIRMVYFCVMMINAVPATKGISTRFAPREIVTGRRLNFKHLKAGFGDYIEATTDKEVTNDMKGRTHACISLGPSGNWQGSQVCFDLETGKVVLRRVIKTLPMPESVIRVINAWGKSQKNADFKDKFEFWDRMQRKYDWENADLDIGDGKLESEHVSKFTDIPAEIPGVRMEAHEQPDVGAIQAPPIPTKSYLAAAARANAGLAPLTGVSQTTGVLPTKVVDLTAEEEEYVSTEYSKGVSKANFDNNIKEERISTMDDFGETAQDVAAMYPGPAYGRGKRVRNKPVSYEPVMTGKTYTQGINNLCFKGVRYTLDEVHPEGGKMNDHKMGVINLNLDTPSQAPDGGWQDDYSLTEHLLGVILVQHYNLKKGIELFGDRAEAATTKELQSIHDFGTYEPQDAKLLSREERFRALSALMFIVEKRNGDIKARKVAVGSKQRTFPGYSKSEWASPTVSTDGVILTSTIEAHEERDVAVIDVPNAFLNANNNEKTLMLLKGKLAELMVQIDPKLYRKHIITSSKGEPMLYVKLSKALYGLLQSALLFYRKLRADLEVFGFVVNPYDPCVANKVINGSQMTVTWHVDDLKISHKDSGEVTKCIQYLQKIYGEKMTIHRGKVHDYLGMDLDFSSSRVLKIGMIKYIKKIHEEFPEEIKTAAATPAAEHLFDVREDNKDILLPEEQALAFHRTTAQLLFLSARARPDVRTAVSFLCTRTKQPDEDDWGKLKRVLKYLYGTLHMKLCLTAENLDTLTWWVDASYAVHWDSRSHTGMVMSLGLGAVMSGSWRQKLNTGSSTEAELVGIDDALKYIMWGLYFLQAQGHEIKKNVLMQDNKSTILMANNGKFSCSKRTKHIKNRYFMIKDKIGRGEIVIQYCPTEDMWADINTKALQGSLFYKMRARLMGVPELYDDDVERRNTHVDLLPKEAQECAISQETQDLLHKAGALRTLMAATKKSLPNATRKTQVAVAALLLHSMTKRTGRPSSHRRSVLGDKGNALEAEGSALHTGHDRCSRVRTDHEQTGYT